MLEMTEGNKDLASTTRRPRRRIAFLRGQLSIGTALFCSITACIAFSALRLCLRTESHAFPASNGDPEWRMPELVWKRLQAQSVKRLTWDLCYRGIFQCARLQVPLDYANISAGHAGIAVIKIPAKVPAGDPSYKGPILFDPGGPGGSGVNFVISQGLLYQELIGREFDIVSFDPRGVRRTTPQVSGFSDDAERVAWNIQMDQDPLPNTTIDAVARIHSRYTVAGSLIARRSAHASPYVSTAAVAGDMLSIIRALGRDQLQYYGLSYGTVLGATFAAMFPDRVGRIILDGNVDIEGYVGSRPSRDLLTTDKGLNLFLQACVDAGSDGCALYESTAAAIHARPQRLLSTLKARPIPVATTSGITVGPSYGLVDYKAVKRLLLSFLYSPYTPYLAETLARAFHAAEHGDGAPLWRMLGPSTEQFFCDCPVRPGHPLTPNYASPEAVYAIMCGDGEDVNDDVDELEAYFARNARDSELADAWPIRALCVTRPVERFTGPFTGNTSYPILFIGNTADPVTALANAKELSRGYNGSVVLTQNSGGHCSDAATSLCTARAIRSYFHNGTLPDSVTVCEVESRMFRADPPTGDYCAEDQKMLTTSRRISELSPARWAEFSPWLLQL